MQKLKQSDYESFHEILDDLMKPITGDGLTTDILIRLYESKLAYLENIRIKCFRQMNSPAKTKGTTQFTAEDYDLIIAAIELTRKTLKYTVLTSITDSLQKS